MRNKKQILIKQAEDLWKQKCLEKWGDRCIITGEPANTFHHFIPKSKSTLLRFDVQNGVPICLKHHYIIHFSKNPDEVYQIIKTIRKKRGKEWCDYIDQKKKERFNDNITIKWLEQVLKDLDV